MAFIVTTAENNKMMINSKTTILYAIAIHPQCKYLRFILMDVEV